MLRSVTKCQMKKKCQDYFCIFENFKKCLGPSRSFQEVIKNDQELKFGTVLVQNSYSGTAPRWTTRIYSNYKQELDKNLENYEKEINLNG